MRAPRSRVDGRGSGGDTRGATTAGGSREGNDVPEKGLPISVMAPGGGLLARWASRSARGAGLAMGFARPTGTLARGPVPRLQSREIARSNDVGPTRTPRGRGRDRVAARRGAREPAERRV